MSEPTSLPIHEFRTRRRVEFADTDMGGIVVGPHNENFADVTQRLESAGALTILKADLTAPQRAAEELAGAIGQLLADQAAARNMGDRGRETVRQNRGATQRTMERLMQLLPAATPV